MPQEPETFSQDEQFYQEREPAAPETDGMPKDNLLLVSGIGLVMLAGAMVLSSFLSFWI